MINNYEDWYRVGSRDGGTFPLIDFQNGNNLVSVKSVDTGGSTWQRKMQTHIEDLGHRGATVNGNTANMVLDLRVPVGGREAAEALVDYGRVNNVSVIISEIP